MTIAQKETNSPLIIIGLAADHGGFELKERMIAFLNENQYKTKDFGAKVLNNTDDYPDYVIPLACVSAMVIMYVTVKIMHLSMSDYITYVLLDGIFGIVPAIFIIFDLVNVIYPSIISVGFSIISLAAIFIFHGREIKTEVTKRMHI